MGCGCGGAGVAGAPATRPSKWQVRLPDGQTRDYLTDTEAYAVAVAEYTRVGRQPPADAVVPLYT